MTSKLSIGDYMIYKKGHWQASYKDTFSLDTTLSPIIYAGLKRFHDVLEQKNREGGCIGVPNEYCANPDVDVTDKEVQDWLDDIKKMIYAFENKAPDISLYDFNLEMVPVPGGVAKEGMSAPYTIECDNLGEEARYHADCKIHEDKVQEGLELTFKKWGSLWW
jgi:hypothetical protein